MHHPFDSVTDLLKRLVHFQSPHITNRDEGATYTYVGKATPGTLDSASAWQIERVVNSTGATRFAQGTSSFRHVWDDRATFSYS